MIFMSFGQILGRAAAVNEGRNAVMAQSYGPESRGGACKTEVILADGEIAYPRVVAPDVAVVLSQEAYRVVGLPRPKECLLIAEEDLVTVDETVERGSERVLANPPVTLAPTAGKSAAFAAEGVFKVEQTLSPGRYVVQLAAQTADAGKRGRVRRAFQQMEFEVK